MDDEGPAAAERRVEAVLSRIAHAAASSQFQLLPAASGGRRGARGDAMRAAAESGRLALVEHGRASVDQILTTRYGQFHPRIVYGWASDPTNAMDRVETSLALNDLVLATAVEDLLQPSTSERLAVDGLVLLDEMGDVQFAAEGIEVGGPVDPDATPRGAIRRMFIVAFAVVVAVGALLVWAELGPIPGLLVLVLAVSIGYTGLTKPGGPR